MHYRAVIVRRAAYQPVGLRNPVVVAASPRFDVFVMDPDVLITVPSGVFVVKAKHMAQFVGWHPFSLLPPKSGYVDLRPAAGFKTGLAGVVASVGSAGEIYVLRL